MPFPRVFSLDSTILLESHRKVFQKVGVVDRDNPCRWNDAEALHQPVDIGALDELTRGFPDERSGRRHEVIVGWADGVPDCVQATRHGVKRALIRALLRLAATLLLLTCSASAAVPIENTNFTGWPKR